MNQLITGPQTWWTRLRRSIDWVIVLLAAGIITLALINLDSAEGGAWQGEMVHDQLLFVAIGTSGTVAPASSFVRWARLNSARRVLLNLEGFDGDDQFTDRDLGPADELVPKWFATG